MTIEELLKSESYNTRLCVNDKWLSWSFGRWEVYQQPYGKHTRAIYQGDSLEEALSEVLAK